MNWTKSIKEAAVVVSGGLFLAVIAFWLRPTLWSMLTNHLKEQTVISKSTEKYVSLTEARDYFYTDKALFADARPAELYRKGHIKGAMNLDPNDFDTWSEPFFDQFAPDLLIIAYCDGDMCPLSTELAEKLKSMGYENIFILKNGWHLWKNAELPIEQVAD